jgi:murein DD-endopeptidase MepM/ murein hydrolase activator NlpD
MSRTALNSLILILCFAVLSACAPTGIYHTVEPGQTLYRIARTYKVEESRLASINNIDDPKKLKANQRIFIPGVTRALDVPTSSTSGKKLTTRSSRKTSSPTKTRATAKSATVKTAPSKKTTSKKTVSTAKPAKGVFVWPAKGKVLNKFGKQGQKVYKGIEIDLKKGSTVTAAASGKVIYSGNAIPGYGNLVIIEHSDSFFSIYGYNHKNLVEMDDFVGQGEKIALSGLPPNGQSARLHFEIRKGKSAVNPILYLP